MSLKNSPTLFDPTPALCGVRRLAGAVAPVSGQSLADRSAWRQGWTSISQRSMGVRGLCSLRNLSGRYAQAGGVSADFGVGYANKMETGVETSDLKRLSVARKTNESPPG